ncbi:periplasmic copper-binding [Methylobacterium sp. 4-46]|uniref:nitrous oxide reductase family maturation protein NosD n=1 Tax=unclassified Methylobacterium TaxID=2615210 RepID=UPI000152D84B|nr:MULTISPECIES: nitrous oxide reductase family maturation protein NosD [Methylobacterium]ACA17283.1 periplasmic copper-binding [Methylobacterium sp. 4-46]WFT82969.1 nitrous oxide reductase family maturation protein NosD [Methylobacterium nodulans]
MLAAILAASMAPSARAERREVSPAAGSPQQAVDAARAGDTLVFRSGRYRGPLAVGKPLAIEGEPGTMIEGDGAGSVITVTSPGVSLRGLEVRGSGTNLERMDSGVFLTKEAKGARVERNRIQGNLFGVYVHGAEDALVRHNTIVGLRDGRLAEAGNGVSVWNAPGAQVVDNDISFGRDGVFTISSKRNVFSRNNFHDLRFAIHYMYTNDSEIRDNISTGNAVGYAIMFSNRLVVSGNVSDRDRDDGFVFNYANGSEVAGNLVVGGPQPAERWTSRGQRSASEHGLPAAGPASAPAAAARIGPEKCVFIYNANQNRFRDNWFEGCEIGIHFTAGSEGNQVSGNAFVANRNQVKYVGTRYLDWSAGGRGNYWSDNPGFDLNGDGLADTAYRPNDIIDKVLWTAPAAKVLVNSPALQVIRWAQSQFPALLPGGVVDTKPLISPPAKPARRGPEP